MEPVAKRRCVSEEDEKEGLEDIEIDVPVSEEKKKFRYRGTWVHLVYKTWMDEPDLAAHLQERFKRPESKWRIWHEESDKDAPYKHTHAIGYLGTEKKISKKPSYWDKDGIHPYIGNINTEAHKRNATKYHLKKGALTPGYDTLPKFQKRKRTDFTEAKELIRNCKTWGEVLLCHKAVMGHMNWAKEVWMNKPQKEFPLKGPMRPWQQDLETELDGPVDDRKVIWIYDKDGNIGKSAYTKYRCSCRKDALGP